MLRNSLSYDYGKLAGLSLSVLVICSLFSARQAAAAYRSAGHSSVDTSIFQPADAPTTPAVDDGMPIEIGVKFRSVQAGHINGIRFYKSKAGSGKYQVHLWSNSGQKLAEAPFTGDSSTGWKEVLFEKPVAITANTTYIAAYFSATGDYASTNPFFTQGVVNGPLHALANGEDGPNGIYKYADAPTFPDDNFGTNNYWVDVVFIPDANSPVVKEAAAAGAHKAGPDTIAPVITALKTASNADGTTTISWTTSEKAAAAIHYNINAEDLSLQTEDNTPSTNHAMRLSGLVPGVTYYFRVASKDIAGNITTKPSLSAPPLKFTLPEAPCAIDRTEFNQGNPDIGAAVTADGGVTLQPALTEEFLSLVKTIPEGWTGARYNNDGTAVNNNGVITANGIHIFSNNPFEPGSTMEFSAMFTAGAYQNIGFSIDQPYVDGPWVTIGQGGSGDGNIYARASNNVEVKLGSNLLDAMHHYKIKWNATNFEFFVDGSAKPAAVINITMNSKMYIQISDYASTDGALSIDWMHVAPYTPSGSFTSRVFDAGDATDWGAVTWHAETPAGTSVAISVSAGNTNNPNDGTWQAFKPINAQGETAGINGRYVQYKATLKTTDTKVTPVLKEVAINCKGNGRMTEKAKESVKPAVAAAPANSGLNIKVMPNPSADYFELVSTTPVNDKPLLVNVLDSYARIVESHRTVTPNTNFQFGQALSPGSYFLEVIQGNQRKTLKLIKIK